MSSFTIPAILGRLNDPPGDDAAPAPPGDAMPTADDAATAPADPPAEPAR